MASKTKVRKRSPGSARRGNGDRRFIEQGRRVIDIEAAAVARLRSRIGREFAAACRLLHACRGRVVLLGIGKSGHVAGKIAATLASTGTPAFYVHPAEASHGDLGMITRDDVVIALSNSGETAEILAILPIIKRLGVPLIAFCGKSRSTLARRATIALDVGVEQEACTLDLAPTASTTAALAMGDALAVALLERRGFRAEDFARSHPTGVLGRRLLLRVADIMHTGGAIPRVRPDTTLARALVEMTRKGLGMTAVVDARDRVLGIYTDGDLRRSLDAGVDVHRVAMRAVMTRGAKTIPGDALAAEALRTLELHKINALLVVDARRRLAGALNMHDLLRAGIV
jgi:arabinose-5-phosphate isomerase